MITIYRVNGSELYTSEIASAKAEAISDAVRENVNLMSANLKNVNLRGADLRGVNLINANLMNADLINANLTGANLMGADLRGADLMRADLMRADLSGANLTGANLTGANLRGANLRSANFESVLLDNTDRGIGAITGIASVTFNGHGECGRQLTAAKIDGEIRMWCGCFVGSSDDLQVFIDNDEPRYRKTRTLAMRTVLELLDANNGE